MGDNAEISYAKDNNSLYSSTFWYDELGRLILSQNAKQFANSPKMYSYTLYDEIGRTIEAGELSSSTPPPHHPHLQSQISYTAYTAWLTQAQARTEVTKTIFDRPLEGLAIAGFEQQNLRNRIASVLYYAHGEQNYTHATHYNYDIHGNVKTLIQDLPTLAEQRYKRLDYSYDLVSNVVRQVVYQQQAADQFAHRYTYDDDNRIVRVETSADPHLLLWNCEAEYKYYRHGPLAQIIIGDSLQTMNYYYTLQGWLKGVNDPLLRTNPTKKIQYLYGYSLHYFECDYKPIAQTLAPPMPTAPTQEVQQTGKNLYNGNIRSMITSIAGISLPTQAMTYQYDQLNRLTATVSHSWDKAVGSFAANNLYDSQYTYDANGNISTLKRNSPKSATILEPTPVDDLTYSYYNKDAGYSRHTNRLSSVTDAITEALYDDEFTAGQAANNYSYDATGNLIADAHEEIEEIRWNVQGKVVYLKRTESSNKPNIEFEYDAMGNRIAKHVKPKNSATHSTYYVRDAQGNTMATYSNSTETITLEEQPIYGSARLGTYSPTAEAGIVRGLRTYEATNHLGNVLTTYTDRIILNEDYEYTPEQTTATDYYPFGMPMPGRSFSVGNYRYGFGSHEKDDEVLGSGNYYGFGDYGLDVRLGRRWRPDPLQFKFPYISSYAAFNDNPLYWILEFNK